MWYISILDGFPEDEAKLRREDSKLPHKLWQLVFDLLNDPFSGIGKPEPLKGNLSGHWSRRITDRHRLIYRVEEEVIFLVSCYGHYED